MKKQMNINNETDAAKHIIEKHEMIYTVNDLVYVKINDTETWIGAKNDVHRYLLQQYGTELGDWIKTVTKWKKVYYMLLVLSKKYDF